MSEVQEAQRVRIPRHVVSAAVRHAQASSRQEVGGVFAIGNDGMVRYLPGFNIADDVLRAVELDPSWIADLVLARGFRLVAFFHSHPGGTAEPSESDHAGFPWYYVKECLIYYGENNRLVSYDASTWTIRKVGADGLLVEMESL